MKPEGDGVAYAGVQLGSPQMLAAPPAVALAFVPKSEALMLLHTELVSRVEPSSDGTLQVSQLPGFCRVVGAAPHRCRNGRHQAAARHGMLAVLK